MNAATMTSVDKADRMARQRATFATILGVVIFATMGVHVLHFAPWLTALWLVDLTLGFAMLLYIGFFLRTPVGALIDDEASRLHRARALGAGFWAGLAAIAIAFVTSELRGGFGTENILRVVASVMIGGALLRFGALERRALA